MDKKLIFTYSVQENGGFRLPDGTLFRSADAAIIEVYGRPIKPSAPERDGKGVKHVGMKFQTSLGECELQAVDSNKVTCCVKMLSDGHLHFCSLDALEPIRTQADRDRDDLIDALTDFFFDGSETLKGEDIADAIIAAGWRKDHP